MKSESNKSIFGRFEEMIERFKSDAAKSKVVKPDLCAKNRVIKQKVGNRWAVGVSGERDFVEQWENAALNLGMGEIVYVGPTFFYFLSKESSLLEKLSVIEFNKLYVYGVVDPEGGKILSCCKARKEFLSWPEENFYHQMSVHRNAGGDFYSFG